MGKLHHQETAPETFGCFSCFNSMGLPKLKLGWCGNPTTVRRILTKILLGASTALFVFSLCAQECMWVSNKFFGKYLVPLFDGVALINQRGPRIAFFDRVSNMPYVGGTLGINGHGPKLSGFGDTCGIYYRRIEDKRVYWTLTVSLWYPTVIFGTWPVLFFGWRWRRICLQGKVDQRLS